MSRNVRASPLVISNRFMPSPPLGCRLGFDSDLRVPAGSANLSFARDPLHVHRVGFGAGFVDHAQA
jgi:hypothetical protein